MHLSRRLAATTILLIVACYALTPALYAASQGIFSADLYFSLLRTKPLYWGELVSLVREFPSAHQSLIAGLLAQTPHGLWSLAAETIRLSPEGRYNETAYVLSLTPIDEWEDVKWAVSRFNDDFMPFIPHSDYLYQHYVNPLPISGEEPVHDWRYIVYLVAVRLVANETSIYEAGRILCLWTNSYMTYDWNYWFRESPIALLKQKKGTCTNFSILFVSLCRSVGIPARLVRDDSFDTATHAWSEFYVKGRGWVHADASAGHIDNPQVYGLERFHLVKAYDPIEGWINVTPNYTNSTGTVIGRVLLHGKPVEGASVSIYVPWNDHDLLTKKTGQNGLFSFVVTNGTYIVKAKYDSHTKEVGDVRVQVNQVANVTLALD